MRLKATISFALIAAAASGQIPDEGEPRLKSRTEVLNPPAATTAPVVVVPAGTKIPLQLRQPVSTKGARVGDPIYAQTTFPIVVSGAMVIPAGTWVQGKVDTVKRAGRIKGTAELQFHLTHLIYGNGYMLDIAAAIDQVPGDTSTGIKEPGIISRDTERMKDLDRVTDSASKTGQIGALAGVAARPGMRGLGYGGLAGIAAGTLIGLLARGSDVTFDTGTAVEIALTQAMAIDRQMASRTAPAP